MPMERVCFIDQYSARLIQQERDLDSVICESRQESTDDLEWKDNFRVDVLC